MFPYLSPKDNLTSVIGRIGRWTLVPLSFSTRRFSLQRWRGPKVIWSATLHLRLAEFPFECPALGLGAGQRRRTHLGITAMHPVGDSIA